MIVAKKYGIIMYEWLHTAWIGYIQISKFSHAWVPSFQIMILPQALQIPSKTKKLDNRIKTCSRVSF